MTVEMIMSALDSLVLYFERYPLWILSLVVIFWAFGFWNRQASVDGNDDVSSKGQLFQPDKGYPPIEPLEDFDWQATEPLVFRPFKPKYHLTMALSNLDISSLIPMDKTYKERVALRASLVKEYPDVVVGVNPVSDERIYAAIRELYSFVVGTYLPTRYPTMFQLIHDPNGQEALENRVIPGQTVPLHPGVPLSNEKAAKGRTELEILATLVDEEMLILLPSEEEKTDDRLPKYILQAYVTCFPSGFDTRKKLGLRLSAIHDPVPGYATKLERSMDRFFARVEVGKLVQRVNWSITTNTSLFAAFGGVHGQEGEKAIREGELDVDSTVMRCERQTLHRLPNTKALVFAFHTYTYPIRTIKDEGLGEDLAAAIDGLKEGNVPEMHWYKRGPIWGDAVKHFLRS